MGQGRLDCPASLWADPHGGVAAAQCRAFAHPDDAVAICAAFLLLAAVLALFTVTAHVQWAAALSSVAIGFSGFAIVPTVQTLVMEKAGHAPTLASAAMQAAFNLANGAGAYLGGLAIAAGFGLASPNLVGAALVASGFAVAAASWAADRRRGTDRAASTGGPHSRSSCRPAAHGGRADGLTGARALPGVERGA